MVTPKSVKTYIDCYEIIEKDIKEAGNITTDGYEILGKLLKGERKSAAVSNTFLLFLVPCVEIEMAFSKQLHEFYFILFFSVSFKLSNFLVRSKHWKKYIEKICPQNIIMCFNYLLETK